MKTIFRLAHRDSPYLVVSKATVYDSRLSFAERGFLLALLALPDDWGFSIRGLASQLKMPRASVANYLKAITKAGYCKLDKARGKDGKFVAQYTLFETPQLAKASAEETVRLPEKQKIVALKEEVNGDISTSPKIWDRQKPREFTSPKFAGTVDLAVPSKERVQKARSTVRTAKPPAGDFAFVTSEFWKRYIARAGAPPPWTGKDRRLLSMDLKRLGRAKLESAIRLAFTSPPRDVSDFLGKAGYTYGVVHSQIPRLEELIGKEERRLRLLKTCRACGKASETSGIDCPKCGEPDAFTPLHLKPGQEAAHA